MTDIELYDATRGIRRIGSIREQAKHAFAIFDGIVQEIYKIIGWFPPGSTYNTRGSLEIDNRWEFIGQKTDEMIRSKYIGKSVEHYLSKGAQNPIKYVNILESHD